MILHTLPIVNEKCLLYLNCSIYFESIAHANYYRKLLCIYSSFSLKHVSPPESFNLFFFRAKFMLRHLLPQMLLSLIPFNKLEKSTNTHTQLLILHCTGVLAHLTVCTHVDENWNWFRLSPLKAHMLFTKEGMDTRTWLPVRLDNSALRCVCVVLSSPVIISQSHRSH